MMDEARLKEIEKTWHYQDGPPILPVATTIHELIGMVRAAWRERDLLRENEHLARVERTANNIRAARAEAGVERLESELSRLEETIGVYLNAPAEDLRRALRRALDAAKGTAG